ncbi:MAG TPA: glucosamine-6-phosphate deaminase [Puia sp.]|jgi:glucosamine-6-phosphate deaminase|nr:glucosamine-6-phosphate deaminase [Puia sp.]
MYNESANDTIRVQVYADRALMGAAAALAAADTIRNLLSTQAVVNIIFAAAPSQNEFLAALSEQPVDWQRINAFHMDEYIGLDNRSSQSFAHYLNQHLFEKVASNQTYYLNGAAADLGAECRRYRALLKQFPADIVCMGIGENNHIAFNDPPVADFDDPETVKIVALAPDCRQQQVNDGCFPSLAAVPERALTLTIPALLDSRHIICVVPGERKAKAVYHTLKSPVSEEYPSTILRKHPSVQLFLDKDSGSRKADGI